MRSAAGTTGWINHERFSIYAVFGNGHRSRDMVLREVVQAPDSSNPIWLQWLNQLLFSVILLWYQLYLIDAACWATESYGRLRACQQKANHPLWNNVSCLHYNYVSWSKHSKNQTRPSCLHPYRWFPHVPRKYLQEFACKLTKKDKRRILLNKAKKQHEMVKKTISKKGKVQVCLAFICRCNCLSISCASIIWLHFDAIWYVLWA